jgi:hypothetical protein
MAFTYLPAAVPTDADVKIVEMRCRFAPLALVFALFFSSGCVEIEVKTTVQENGSGTQLWRFNGTGILASEIKKQVQNNKYFKHSAIRDHFKEGDYILETNIDFKDVSELRNADREVQFVTTGFLMKTHTYTEVWKRSGDPAGLLAQHAQGLVPVTFRVAIELPGSIIETNADWKEGAVARWTVSVSDLASSKMLVAKSRSWNWALIVPAIIILIAAFAGFIILGYRMVQRQREPALPTSTCSTCGANVPVGSTYCNFCGNAMIR